MILLVCRIYNKLVRLAGRWRVLWKLVSRLNTTLKEIKLKMFVAQLVYRQRDMRPRIIQQNPIM